MALALPAAARAARATVALDVDACGEVPELAVRQIVSIEIGDLLAPRGGEPPPDGYRLVARCGSGAAHLEARAASRPDRLERTLRLDDFPGDAAPRALALAGIEMLAALDPAVRARVEAKPPPVPAPAAAEGLALTVAGVHRRFFGEGGAVGWGGRFGVDRRFGSWILGADLEVDRASTTLDAGETRAWLASLGAFGGLAAASGRLAGSLSAGVRGGLAWLSGSPAPGSGTVGHGVTRPWFGPALAARAAVGGARVAVFVSLEVGWVVRGAQGLVGDATAIAIEGGWLTAGLGVRF